jgi:DNA-binding response OmpR family regulator
MKGDIVELVAVPGLDGGAPSSVSIWFILFAVLLIIVCFYIVYRIMTANERKKLEELKAQMKRENEKEMDLMKQRVLSNVSQELLTPLTLVISPLQQLMTEPLADDLRGRIQMVLRNAQILLHQVNMLPSGTKSSIIPAMLTPTTPIIPQGNSSEQTKESQNEANKGENLQQAVDDSNVAKVAVEHGDVSEEENKEEEDRFTMLMVDDSPDMCRFVRDYFRGEYNVLTANNGEQAVKLLIENEHVDLVVSDVTMPKMDGMELCRQIKTDLRWSHIPVILLTGRNNEELEMKGLALGADDYITKPFNVEMLRLRMKKFMEKKADRQRKFRENADVLPSDITITPVDEEFIQRAIQICENNLSDVEFSVEALGREMELSRTYLYKKILNITGKAPGEFIRTIRMKRGKQYLEKTNMAISEIASALGYNSPKRFTENFKNEYGMSPSEYLRQVRSDKASKK